MKTKILIIEDEKDLAANIKNILESYGYIVYTACNGKDGIKLARHNLPDLIICDIMMPGMDGYEVIKELNKDSRNSLIPFIFLTAKAELKDIRMGMASGADDYILKPFSVKDLLSSIQSRLKKFESIKANILSEKAGEDKTKTLTQDDSVMFQINNSPCLIKVGRIVSLRAERQYTRVLLKDGKSIVVRKSLAEWGNILPDNIFMRIHRSTIINTEYIIKITRVSTGSYRVVMPNNPEGFEVSRGYYKKLRDKLHI